MKLKNKNIKLLILILGIIVLVISTSYAVFSIRHENTDNQVISAGELELTYNSCSTMTTEMVPMSNTEGMNQTGCSVTVENTGSLDAIYKVLIYNNPSGSNYLSHDNLYISIDNSTPVLLSTITKLENTDKYNLKEEILLVGETRSHNIKIWIKEDATTDIVGKSINLIVDVEAEIYESPSFLASESLSSPTETSVFWGGTITRDLVETISFTTTNEVPAGVIGSWDAGLEKNGKVMAWYTDADTDGRYELVVGANGGVYASENSSLLFYRFENLDNLNLTNLDTSRTTTMNNMFSYAGFNGTSFTLDLGDKFDTSNVTNMQSMFYYTGRSSTVFTLDLEDKFDTSNVTNMYCMFYETGYSSIVFTLDLRDKFETNKVTDMLAMFSSTGYNSLVFTLDLRDKFDTSNVEYMHAMFSSTGYSSPVFTLDLGDKFDVNNSRGFTRLIGMVIGYYGAMQSMFSNTGYSNSNFTLDLKNVIGLGGSSRDQVYSHDSAFKTGKSSHKIYAKDTVDATWIGDNKGFTGTIINCTTSPASCPQ